jgi:hypothetical protein
MERINVVRVFPDADLRMIHSYRRRVARLNLRPGQAVLYVNRDGDKARLIDSARAVHNYYAPQGTEFDLDMMQRSVRALKLVLMINASKARRAFNTDRSESKSVPYRRAA